jgi:hypothetical protein
MKSKYFFEEFKRDMVTDHKRFKTHMENQELSEDRCDHMGKVKMKNGMLRCSCGAAWSGPQLDILFDHFNKKGV